MPLAVRFDRIGGPEVLSLDEVEVPRPGPGEVRIRTRALGLNRVDVMVRTGQHFLTPRLPQMVGAEAAGVVESVGAGVTTSAVGDVVSVVPAFTMTEYALAGDLVLVPARAVVHHPDTLSFEQAAATWMAYTTAYGGLIEVAEIKRGDVVVIPAASSSVGLAAIQIATMVGARAVALTRSPSKRRRLLEAGAAEVVTTDNEDVTARLDDITSSEGVDVVFDPVGGPLLTQLLDAAAFGARVVIYGALSEAETSLPVIGLLSKRLTIRGFDMAEVTTDDGRLHAAITFILDGLSTGALTPTVDRTFDLSHVVEPYAYLEVGSQFGKVVVNTP